MDKRFNIEDIIKLRNLEIRKTTGKETLLTECPFCGKKRGSFSVMMEKGFYHGWCCDEAQEGGNAIKLYMKTSQKQYPDTKEGYKMAVRDIFKELNGQGVDLSQRPQKKPDQPAAEIAGANLEERDRTYREILRLLSLSKKDKADLLRRGLTEKQIAYFGFRSVPSREMGRMIAASLKKNGFAMNVPGIYKSKDRYEINFPKSGYLCPVFTKDRKICGFQVRVDLKGDLASAEKEYSAARNHTPADIAADTAWAQFLKDNDKSAFFKVSENKAEMSYQGRNLNWAREKVLDGNKYIWLSSAGKDGGLTSGSPATFLMAAGKDADHRVTVITEGILKATIVYTLLKGRVNVVGVPGISSLGSLTEYLTPLKNKQDIIILEAFDMDKKVLKDDASVYEEVVQKAKAENISPKLYLDKLKSADTQLSELRKSLRIGIAAETLRASVQVYHVPCRELKWDFSEDYWRGNYKGLDDFLLNYPDTGRIVEKMESYIPAKSA